MNQDATLRISAAIVRWVLLAAAPLVPLTQLSQLLGIAFRSYAAGVWGWLVLVACLAVFRFVRSKKTTWSAVDRNALAGLCALSLAAATLAISVHVSSRDDFYYAPNPVYYVENPTSPMGFEVHGLLGSGDTPFFSTNWSTAVTFEYVEAALAYGLRAHFLTVYHIVAPAFFAAFVPWVLFGLLRRFDTDARRAALATAGLMLTILLMGDTLRSFGSYFLLRAYQGKTIGFMIGLPLFASLSIRYLRRPSKGVWWQIVALTTWMSGTTTPSIVLFPPLSLALAAGQIDIEKREDWWRTIRYGSSQFYLVGYALLLLAFSGNTTSNASPINEFWPKDFLGHARFFFNPEWPVTIVLFAVFVPLAFVLSDDATRRLLAAWWGVLLLICLNPWVAPWLMANVTTANIYWRLFYLVPFLPSIGICYLKLLERLESQPRERRIVAATALVVLPALVALFAPFSPLRRAYAVGGPGWKVPDLLRNEALAAIDTVPPGPMLAPADLCGVIPMLGSDYPQIRIRIDGVRQWLGERGLPEDAMHRIRASEFSAGKVEQFESFDWVLRQYPALRSVLLRKAAEPEPSSEVRQLLAQHGFSNRADLDGHVAFWKSAPAPGGSQ